MGRAEALERLSGRRHGPGGGPGVRRQPRRPGRRAGRRSRSARRGRCPTWPPRRATSGLARAYVTGDLEVDGDLYTALAHLARLDLELSLGARLRLLRELGGVRLLRPPPRPAQEVRLRGRRHSKARDQRAIAHHYDVSNRFYEWLLGPSMAYTCAVYPTADATLEQAQFAKHDLVARKLALRPGMRLLDVGCGWGGMVMHAAREYGVRALGVTLSRRQAEWAQKAIAEAGLSELAEVRHLDYRDVARDRLRRDQLDRAHRAHRPGAAAGLLPVPVRQAAAGRAAAQPLHHAAATTTESVRRRWFISRYVFPDGELTGVGRLVSAMHDTGFEVRHEENLREHYALTTAAWSANLDAHWDEAVAEVGLARPGCGGSTWPASGWASSGTRSSCTRSSASSSHADGRSGMPLRPDWEPSPPRR